MDTTTVETISNANPLIFAILPIAGALIAAFAGAFYANHLQNKSDNQKRLEDDRNDLLGILTAIKAQFERNWDRINDAETSFNQLIGYTDPVPTAPTPRLIVIAIEGNIEIITRGIKDFDLLKDILTAYEEHKHLNNRWAILREYLRNISTWDSNSIKSHYLTEIKACEVVAKLTEDTTAKINGLINKLKSYETV